MAEKNDALLEKYINVYMSVFKYIGDLVSEPTKRYKLSFEQFLIMRDVENSEQVGMSDIAAKRGVTRAAISRQIKVMLDHHYLVQERDPIDRRRLYLRLTPEGKQVTTKINQAIRKVFEGWVDMLGSDKANDLLSIMEEVGEKIIRKGQGTPKA
ncbi:MarR family winged helix-turn-helix transcriptional regulator [Loigolactobacillus bifermentans]|nr:MarR family transcriptional regulator [Loigolactobacillus bifermentans]QGG60188.1 MarR family transcriptional regulator [Loigolactobacillus bifermentans]